MERVIFKHLYNYLHSNDLIYKYQSGFLPSINLLICTIKFVKDLMKKKTTCIVFCDISKAFDRVWHSGLLYKQLLLLKQYGIIGKFNKWIENYVSNRMQRVFVGSSFSETKYISKDNENARPLYMHFIT
jgi:hypothetical protein